MNPRDPNVLIIELVAAQLGPLSDQFVYVGGSTTGLFITDAARPPVRATKDVDVIVEVSSFSPYHALEAELRKMGFRDDGEIICRWRHGDLKLDVMPTDQRLLGFTNRWYKRAVQQARHFTLPSGKVIRLISPPLFVATKLEAFIGRGQGDYGASPDIEDIVTIIDGRHELISEIEQSDDDIKAYLEDEIEALLSNTAFTDTLSFHFHGDAVHQERVTEVIRRLRQIAGI